MKFHRAAALALLALLVFSGSLGSADAKKKAKRASKKAAKAADGADFVIAGEFFPPVFFNSKDPSRNKQSAAAEINRFSSPLFPPALASFCFLVPRARDCSRWFLVDRRRETGT